MKLGEAATHLPWLCPCAASLSALARKPTDAWDAVRFDPAAVLLVIRQTALACADPVLTSFPALVYDPAVPEGAVALLDEGVDSAGFVDWSQPSLQPVYSAARNTAALAQQVAEASGACDPATAWAAALLTPLGWFAVSALDPSLVAACREDPAHVRHPAETEVRHWGLDALALSRRLSQRWRLPRWLAAVLGHLSLPVELAERFGAPPAVFRVVQLAVALAQQAGLAALHFPIPGPTAEQAAALGLSADRLATLLRETTADAPAVPAWESPRRLPLLRDLLELAAENRRLRHVPALADLQREADQLHQALEAQLASEGERLRAQKLAALAEFAAGAGHEINNPLAVISGQAQYLLKKVMTEECRVASGEAPPAAHHSSLVTSLNTIIQQTKRIHQILTELMQFARPPRPQKEEVDAADLVREAAATLHETAARGQVEILCPEAPRRVALHADPQQVRTALICLLRNAVESAPAGGWARVQVEAADPEFIELVVEDNGPGPAPAQREHLFDPFYSGRHAGRGRGLGLPTAWRLAREHGGDVRFEGRAGCPTRFVLSLPRGTGANGNGKHDRHEPVNGVSGG